LPGVGVYYPVKVNPYPAVMATLAGLGHGFDVASAHEIDLALEAGVDAKDIMFSHTMKLPTHMKRAREVGVEYSTADAIDELQKHAKFWPEAKILLRIGLPKNTESAAIKLGSKFGADPEEIPEF